MRGGKEPKVKPDALRHLADALGEDIANASEENHLAEAAEDFGERGALAVAFDEILAREILAGVTAPERQRSIAAVRVGNLADALSEDIAATPQQALLNEAAEDFGDPRALQIDFDHVVDHVMERGPAPAHGTVIAPAASSRLGENRRAFPVRLSTVSPWAALKGASAMLAAWLAAPLRSRTALGAFAAILLAAVSAPGIYQLLVERTARQIETTLWDGPPAPAPMPKLSAPAGSPAPTAAARPPVMSPPAPPPPPISALPPAPSETPLPAALPEPASREPEQLDRAAWQRINQDDLGALHDFVEKFPSSPLAVVARNRYELLKRFEEEREEFGRQAAEAQRIAQETAQRRAEEERKQAEVDRQRIALETAQRRAEEERRQAEADRQHFVLEAARRAEDERKQAEAERQRAEQEAARRAEDEKTRVAALSPPPQITQQEPKQPTVQTPNASALSDDANTPRQIRKAQQELRRLECFDGRPDGNLDSRTEQAVKNYWTKTGHNNAGAVKITDEFITELEQQDEDVCKPGRTKQAPAVAIQSPPRHQPARQAAHDSPAPRVSREQPFAGARPAPRPAEDPHAKATASGGGAALSLGVGH
jgi:hypothetical protein